MTHRAYHPNIMARRSSVLAALLLLAPLVVSFMVARSPSISSSTRQVGQPRRRALAAASRGGLTMKADWALLFDCDGVLADTERDGACRCPCGLCIGIDDLSIVDCMYLVQKPPTYAHVTRFV